MEKATVEGVGSFSQAEEEHTVRSAQSLGNCEFELTCGDDGKFLHGVRELGFDAAAPG